MRSLQYLPRSVTLPLTVLRQILDASPSAATGAAAQPIGHVLLDLSPDAGSDGSPLLTASEFCKGKLPSRSAEPSNSLRMQVSTPAQLVYPAYALVQLFSGAEFSASMYKAFVTELLECMVGLWRTRLRICSLSSPLK